MPTQATTASRKTPARRAATTTRRAPAKKTPDAIALLRADQALLRAKTTGRRLAFANWITQPNHPLTARVMVNRIIAANLSVGSRLPAYATAMGRTLLADLPRNRLDELSDAERSQVERRQWLGSRIARISRGDNPHDGLGQPVSCAVIASDHGRPHLRRDKAHCAVQHEQAIEA